LSKRFPEFWGSLPNFEEAPADGQQRFITTIQEIYQQRLVEKNILIVGHGDAVNAIGYRLKTRTNEDILIYDTQECCFLIFDPTSHTMLDHSRLAIAD
jgi:broad specificity phosphatase PhoE